MNCETAARCEPTAVREGELRTDVLVIGGGLGGLVSALELKKYGYDVKVAYVGPLGGHHVLGMTEAEVESIVAKSKELELFQGFFDGFYLYSDGVKYRAVYKHLILATGGVDLPVTFPKSRNAPQKTAEEILASPPTGLKIAVWGTTEWGLRTAITLRRIGNEILVLDNSAYLRDVKYYEKIKSQIDFNIVSSVRIKKYENGELTYEIVTGGKNNEVQSEKIDLLVSTVRVVNPYVAMRLGFRVFYSFELNSLIPRRSNYGELLILDDRGYAKGGSNVYATGHLYGVVKEKHVIEQAKLLAKYIAYKDGLERKDDVEKDLEEFLVLLTIEANWLYNLGHRLEKGTDGTGRYVEPNVIDVPHWASYWPQLGDEEEDIVVCPCNGSTLGEVVKEIEKINKREIKPKITHDEVDILRSLKLVKLGFEQSVCTETICIPYAAIILGAYLSQKPSYFIYGKPDLLNQPA
ncbi:MAG: FAD-dependent oxidoreductase [Pyrobaculum sp.]